MISLLGQKVAAQLVISIILGASIGLALAKLIALAVGAPGG